jgi:hypothetical protein|tara:strand:- start:47 stop:466 length:420 start_codon:yes stop_codon:yes gene_type:complete
MALLDAEGNPIKKKVDESQLPTVEQILQDPITKKFVFLTSDAYPEQTCIGLTAETDFHGVVYKYGQVTLPNENEMDANNNLNLKFKYDILENNGIPKENFNEEFFKLIGDILYHIIITQSEDNTSESINRTNNAEQSSN